MPALLDELNTYFQFLLENKEQKTYDTRKWSGYKIVNAALNGSSGEVVDALNNALQEFPNGRYASVLKSMINTAHTMTGEQLQNEANHSLPKSLYPKEPITLYNELYGEWKDATINSLKIYSGDKNKAGPFENGNLLNMKKQIAIELLQVITNESASPEAVYAACLKAKDDHEKLLADNKGGQLGRLGKTIDEALATLDVTHKAAMEQAIRFEPPEDRRELR